MVESDITEEKIIREINKKFLESIENYRNIVTYLSADVPIGVLCLAKKTEKLLIARGIERVYDLFNFDLTKIEGLHANAIRDLTTRLNQFLAIS